MHRKHFISLTSLSLAGLIFRAKTGGIPQYSMALPGGASIQFAGSWQKLTAKQTGEFNYRDVLVSVKNQSGILPVMITCPTISLTAVRLSWKHNMPKAATVLGDHWERTYGDVSWKKPLPGIKMPWYFIQHNGSAANCYGVKTGCNSICYWMLDAQHLHLIMDVHSGGEGVNLGQRTLHAADIIISANEAGEPLFATARRFCKMMCNKPRLTATPVYGINDWYFSYGKNSAELILQHTSLLTDLAPSTSNRPFSVIDAGWAAYSPLYPNDCCWQDDYSRPNDHFKDMHKLAANIEKLGMRPGLWTRPLCASYKDKENLLLPLINGRDNAKQPILDPTIADNIERVKRNIGLYKQWNYHLVKHDYTTYDIMGKWGFQMTENITEPGWHMNDTTKTNAEIILHLYRSIREAAGDMYIIGCNTLSHLSAGVFEIARIGDDTSGKEWERTRKMGVNTLAFRMPQHRNFYEADADCVGVTNEVPWQKNKQWMQLLAESSTPLFISAQPDAVGAEQKEFIKKCFTTAAHTLPVGEPLDWLTTSTPSKWKLDGKVIEFDWS